ncbi:4-carboxymuconolactone decarboxylase [Nocardioides cavernae]|uniref:4-carboxymuconolactone decarboxylase n=1 Tax=Nocardioides cavernae TaxID=1921566 RepID=A0A7Y9KRP6_9ACTN|nr:carboxymuconolactone decarboxylase family protein [Nocardioides cavernae]NYE36790.1 4-carboxymuconolactone decarboxylase [Nocardioides cavernae]
MRLPRLLPSGLDPAQRDLRERIVGGPRARGPRLFALEHDDGSLTGPFGIMLHHPAVGGPLQELGAALRYRTGLTDRVREIAILCVAAATDSAFERYAHEQVGRSVGLTDDELEALAEERFTSTDRAEHAAYDLCRRLLAGRPVLDDRDHDVLVDVLGAAALTELVALVGYYRLLADLMHVHDVRAPSGE